MGSEGDAFWRGKRVFITGHTGFKGSWLCLWLTRLGAEVTGYSLPPPTTPSVYETCGVGELVKTVISDVRDAEALLRAMSEARPEIVIHMAAQPLVRDSYDVPAETYAINVMGTVNLLDAARRLKGVRALVNVTTDKCYENREWPWGYREDDRLGGYDPYSNSKACSELVTAAYRSSFFNPRDYRAHGAGVATARAGNVIGGGDWAADRLVPDCMRALLRGERIHLRNPNSVRPWQHVLEPLSGYMLLARRLYEHGPEYAGGWNFGPAEGDEKTVEWLVGRICEKWGAGPVYVPAGGEHPHEAGHLKLDCSKARSLLGWRPRWGLDKAIDSVIEWTRAYRDGGPLREVCVRQIEEYSGL